MADTLDNVQAADKTNLDVISNDAVKRSSLQVAEHDGAGEQMEGNWHKKLVRKIDWHLLPLMVAAYMIQFLDKQTLNQASIMGMREDLGLIGNQYSWAGAIFYFGYLTFSYPGGMLMVRFPIAKFLSICFVAWGVILACHAATGNFVGIMIVRFMLGAAEASISPGFSLITGMWYLRHEQPLRHGIWFSGNSMAVAFGGLLAYGIAHIQSGIASWKWLFILYAIITVITGVLIFIFLPDSPSTARFLSPRERTQAEERLQSNQSGGVHHKIEKAQIIEALMDYKIWTLVLFQLANQIPNGGFTVFQSLVIQGFGFNTLQVFLLGLPQGAIHVIFMVGSTFLAGKFRNSRCFIAAGCISVSLIGMILVRFTHNQVSQLIGAFLFMASAAGTPLALSIVTSNVAGFTKKATVSAMLFIAYCVGNIAGPFFFIETEAPGYQTGFLTIIICFACAIVLILALRCFWQRENRKRDQLYGEQQLPSGGEPTDGKSTTEVVMMDQTDVKNTNFRYVL